MSLRVNVPLPLYELIGEHWHAARHEDSKNQALMTLLAPVSAAWRGPPAMPSPRKLIPSPAPIPAKRSFKARCNASPMPTTAKLRKMIAELRTTGLDTDEIACPALIARGAVYRFSQFDRSALADNLGLISTLSGKS